MVKEYPAANRLGVKGVDAWLCILLYVGIASLLFLSIFYYKLRDGLGDTPYDIIKMVYNGGFVIENYRFASILNQWLPALLLQFGASLKAIAIAYSFCYLLTPMLLALLAIHWLKQPFTAYAILLFFTVMNSLLFYYPVSELQIGLSLLIFYNGIVSYCVQVQSRKLFFIVASVLIIPTVAFCHPMAAPTFAAWVIYRVAARDVRWYILSLPLLCFAVAYVVKSLYFVSGYEAAHHMTWQRVTPFGLNYYIGPFGKSFYKYLIDDAFAVLLVVLCTLAILIHLRKWILLTVGIGLIGLLYTIVIIAFEDFNGTRLYDYYFEHHLQAPVLILVLVFAQALASVNIDKRLKTGAVAAVLVISLVKINNRSQWHIARQRWEYGYLNLLDHLHIQKAALSRKWVPEGMPASTIWSVAPEMLLLSSLQGPDRAKTLFIVDNEEAKASLQKTDLCLVGNWSLSLKELPKRYFTLGNKPYLLLDNHVHDSVLEHMKWR